MPHFLRRLFELFERPRYEQLPPNVTETIEQQQQSSEFLIGWIQLGILMLFTLLYAASPKTFSTEMSFAPVPVFLTVYLVATLIRLMVAWKTRLPNWLVYASIITDISLLYGLIWSFHVQYEQPASFYLKSPTLLYVFIFIAVRALRLQVRFVALTGLVAAAGWFLMATYAVTIDSGASITRDYVSYLTSNSVLLGAEVDKVVSILVVTLVLMVAIAQGRQLLVSAVAEHSTAVELARFVPDSVAARVSSRAAHAGDCELGEATILFTDIEKFTTLAESLEPQQLIDTLNRYFGLVVPLIELHGGVISQFQGDAILATFNLPNEDPRHASNAVNAAIAIQSALHETTFPGARMRTRIGVNTGRVVGGFVGTDDRLGYTVHGDAVNVAARLEQLNKKFKTDIIISESTRRAAGDLGADWARLGDISLTGKTATTPVYGFKLPSPEPLDPPSTQDAAVIAPG